MGFSLTHVYIPGGNCCEGKLNDMLVSWHNKLDWQCTRDYAERCQLLSEKFTHNTSMIVIPFI